MTLMLEIVLVAPQIATNTGNIDTTYANGPDFARSDAFGGSATAVYNISDAMTFKSITGYRQILWDIGTDLDGTPESLQEVTDQQHQWQVSQEFQLLGKALDNKLNYVGGLYYFKEAGYVHDYVPFESLLYVYDVANEVENENYAAFIHADYQLNDAWGFTAGGRYTEVKTHFLGGQSDLPCFVRSDPLCFRSSRASRTCGTFPDSGQPVLGHLRPDAGYPVPLQPGRDGLYELGQGFKQGGWTTACPRPSPILPSRYDRSTRRPGSWA
jgi:iron complex outermembrane receptor protein